MSFCPAYINFKRTHVLVQYKFAESQTSHKKNLLLGMFIPPAIFSLFMTTENTGVSLLFRIIYSGRLLAVAPTGSPTALKQWVFMRTGSFPPFDWSAHRCVNSHPASARKRIFQLDHSTCARCDLERLDPGHTDSRSIPASVILWCLHDGELGAWGNPAYSCFTTTVLHSGGHSEGHKDQTFSEEN